MKKVAVINSVWDTIVSAYDQGGRTRVSLPLNEIVDVLSCVLANVISQMPDPVERELVMRELAPRVDRLVGAVRARPDIHLASRPNLVLPH